MNHTYVRDKTRMRALLDSDIAYVGMLGPRERTESMLEELEGEGRGLSEEQRQRLYGPVGLDIGTETPEEIALSAVSEIQAIHHQRLGGPLRTRQGPNHSSRTPIDTFSAGE
jgi:xanthine/CO dehydrogenase XdhC/CoxF family maturation factor